MIYLKIHGNAGNQLFQYAFARKLSMVHKQPISVIYKERNIDDGIHKPTMVLEHLKTAEHFREISLCASRLHCLQVCAAHIALKMMLLARRILRLRPKCRIEDLEERYAHFLERIGAYRYSGPKFIEYKFEKLLFDDMFVCGCFEAPGYFSGIRDTLLEEITPLDPPFPENRELYEVIRSTESICVHIRRFEKHRELNSNFPDTFFTVDAQHYINGINYIKKLHPDATIIIFTNDFEWYKKNLAPALKGEKVYFESGKDPVYEVLRLMYSCKHFVMSNSTLSWWGQYLCRNENKIVVGPTVWRKDIGRGAISMDSWVYLDKEGKRIYPKYER